MSGWSDAIAEDVAAVRRIAAADRRGCRVTLLRAANWIESLRDEVIALRALRDAHNAERQRSPVALSAGVGPLLVQRSIGAAQPVEQR